MNKKLVIVESPAKAKTIGKILGKDYIIRASMGHIRDLPEREFGVPFLSAVQDYPEMGRRLYDALKNHPEPEPVRDFVPCRLIG